MTPAEIITEAIWGMATDERAVAERAAQRAVEFLHAQGWLLVRDET